MSALPAAVLIPASELKGGIMSGTVKQHGVLAQCAQCRDFARVETLDQLLHFLARFGQRGAASKEGVVFSLNKKFAHTLYFDPVDVTKPDVEKWLQEAQLMRACIELYERTTKYRLRELSAFIRWEVGADRDIAVRYESPRLVRVIASSEREPKFTGSLMPGDSLGPALEFISDVVNEHLKGTQRAIVLMMTSDPRVWNLFPFVDVKTLSQALWLQFGQAVQAENRRFYPCARCGVWFEKHPQAPHHVSNYCSNLCRVAAYRARKETK
jgi:hypothetical protein